VKNGHVTSVELKNDPVISGSELSNMNLHHLQIDLLKSPREKICRCGISSVVSLEI